MFKNNGLNVRLQLVSYANEMPLMQMRCRLYLWQIYRLLRSFVNDEKNVLLAHWRQMLQKSYTKFITAVFALYVFILNIFALILCFAKQWYDFGFGDVTLYFMVVYILFYTYRPIGIQIAQSLLLRCFRLCSSSSNYALLCNMHQSCASRFE